MAGCILELRELAPYCSGWNSSGGILRLSSTKPFLPQSEAASAGSHGNSTPGKDQLGEKPDFTVRKKPGLKPQAGQAGTGAVQRDWVPG